MTSGQNESCQPHQSAALLASGGHGTLSTLVLQIVLVAQFATQVAGYQRFSDLRLAPVVTGCDRVSGTGSSTNLVHPPLVDQPAILTAAITNFTTGRRRRRAANGKRLRICIYARYSTEEQDESSIADQFAFCLKFLETLGIDLESAIIEKFSDPETSGETVYRPGINQVREGVENKRWDILICEDVSRLFRNLSACCELVETAYDNGIRVIAINDDVDSSKASWEDRFYEAAQHHAKTNRFTSFRIKRRFDALWEMGAAMGPLRSGYRRIYPSEEFEGKGRSRRKKPKFDEIDDEWKDTVYKAFEKIAADEEPWLVADLLTEKGLPKCKHSRSKKWNTKNVIALIRNTIYRGVETWRQTTTVRKKRTGKKRQVRNEPSQIRSREMPHLQIVPDWLWHAANDKIDKRMRKKQSEAGEDHPLAELPRDSRFPLSKLFICNRCKEKMWSEGRNEGGYRCSQVRSGECWNKTTAVRDCAHRQISRAVVDELLAIDGVLSTLVTHIDQRVRDDDLRRQEEKDARKSVARLERECNSLGEAIASREGQDVPHTLIDLLQQREGQLAGAKAELELVQQNLASPPHVSNAQIRERIAGLAENLLDLDRSSGPLLARLIDGKVQAVPHLQFDTTKVVLRAEFTFRPVGILPDDLLVALSGQELDSVVEILPAKRIVVDLFEPSSVPKYAIAAVKLKEENPKITLQRIGDKLGISKRQGYLALQLGLKMREAGIEDPFIRLKERPAKVARWT